MKRVFSILIVLALAMTLACAAFAGESEFVPSISEKPAPEIVEAIIKDEEGNIISEVTVGHLVITPVSEANTSEEIPEAAREELLNVYEQLADGTMILPGEKLDPNLSADELIVRDLFDLSWICTEASPTHEELLGTADDGNVLVATFKMNIAADVKLYAMTYKNADWDPIVSVENNGDGTVTCVFEHLCPVAFILGEDNGNNPSTGVFANTEMFLWIAVMLVSTGALVCVVANNRKKQA